MEVLLASNLFLLMLFLSAGFWYARCDSLHRPSLRTALPCCLTDRVFRPCPELVPPPPCASRSGTLTILVGFRYLLGTLDIWSFPDEAPLQVRAYAPSAAWFYLVPSSGCQIQVNTSRIQHPREQCHRTQIGSASACRVEPCALASELATCTGEQPTWLLLA